MYVQVIFVFPAFNVFNSAAAARLHWKVSVCQFFTDLSLGEYQSQGKTLQHMHTDGSFSQELLNST